MVRYHLPKGMRYSTLDEREKFYRDEFELERVRRWFEGRMKKVIFAVVIGRHTRIYPKKYEEDASTTIIIERHGDLEEVRDWILEFMPESVYYDRNIYDEKGNITGQEMAFDLDPENLTCPIHGTLTDKMRRHQGLSFCELELQMVKEETINLYKELKKTFSSMEIVYSGRGFHIHVSDERAFKMSYGERRKLARNLKDKGYLIDEWVTSGGMRMIRLPYSLHGMVSRIVIPVGIDELKNFNPIEDQRCIPRFLKL
ncbi:MAG: DNA primase [archaeon]|nr:DNA primase [archaeon]MCP8305940.1 DNA primase [archaeon]